MKPLILFMLLTAAIFAARAQPGLNYHPLSIGLGYGLNNSITSVEKTRFGWGLNANLNYYASPYSSITAEVQFGVFSGGRVYDPYAKSFSNNYTSLLLHADIQGGQLISFHDKPLQFLKNFYLGIGAGILLNNITYIQTAVPGDNNYYKYFKNRPDFVIPVRAGYEYKYINKLNQVKFRVDVNYSFNTAFGEGFDGYDDPNSIYYFRFYNYYSIGIKYDIGGTRGFIYR